jgi:pimeloyl-ACP methyl ester carboxylesterase
MTESQPFRRVTYDLPIGPMAAIAMGDPERPVDVVFLHATGFNALTYRTILAPLGERLHVVAVDLRGHGKTNLPAKLFGYAGWVRHRDDVISLIDKGIGAPVTLAGHSMGACVSALVAGKRPDMVRGLALLDPVILPPRFYAMMRAPGAPLLSQQTVAVSRARPPSGATSLLSREEMAAAARRGGASSNPSRRRCSPTIARTARSMMRLAASSSPAGRLSRRARSRPSGTIRGRRCARFGGPGRGAARAAWFDDADRRGRAVEAAAAGRDGRHG